jgi:hypothetical protein
MIARGAGKRMLTLHHTLAFSTAKVCHIGNSRILPRRFPNKVELRDRSPCREFLRIPQLFHSGTGLETLMLTQNCNIWPESSAVLHGMVVTSWGSSSPGVLTRHVAGSIVRVTCLEWMTHKTVSVRYRRRPAGDSKLQ